MANKIPRVPVREQDPKVRATNFEEVCYGYDLEKAALEASRCLQCKNPRCVAACPVNIRIPDFIGALHRGELQQAADIIAEDSSLPSICGRVCPQESQCEGSCILGIKSEPVAIGKLERFVGDWKLEHGAAASRTAPRNGRRVAVIGSGPAGLACASDLAKMGYGVKIFEALHKVGGVLVYGIPEFRLPKQRIVAREIAEVERLGVEIETDVIVGRTVTVDSLLGEEGYDAVFIGSGAGLPRFMGIPGENLNGVVSANEFLTRANLMRAYDDTYDTPIYVGKRVVVVGGGNVAMDAVRTAKRLGAEATIVYRRSEKELPARVEEVHHAKQEGICFRMLTNPAEVLGDERGWVTGIRCVEMELGEPDQSGRRSPIVKPGSEFDIACDVVIMALGTSPNPLLAATTTGLETDRRGCITADGRRSLRGRRRRNRRRDRNPRHGRRPHGGTGHRRIHQKALNINISQAMKSIKIMAAAIALCGMTACGDNTPKTFTGFITDASMNTVTVENAEGTFTFSTMDADKSEANGLLLGAPVVVDYKGKLEDGAAAAKVATDPTYAEAVGKWTMPDPIDPEGVMGIEILIEGQAQSINMATLRYTSWELQGEAGKILLKGQSVGNGQTIDFTETGIIAKDADGVYTLTIEGNKTVYTKATK